MIITSTLVDHSNYWHSFSSTGTFVYTTSVLVTVDWPQCFIQVLLNIECHGSFLQKRQVMHHPSMRCNSKIGILNLKYLEKYVTVFQATMSPEKFLQGVQRSLSSLLFRKHVNITHWSFLLHFESIPRTRIESLASVVCSQLELRVFTQDHCINCEEISDLST